MPVLASSPTDDFWYRPVNGPSVAGIRIDADSAMRTSAVWGCVRVISETIAQAPLLVYERLEDNSRKKANGYYLYSRLHDQPNEFQTAFEWKEMMTAHAILRGNGYSKIIAGRSGFADQLIPLHPDRVTPEQLRNGSWYSNGMLSGSPMRYKVRNDDGTEDILKENDIFHLRGLSNGGLKGMAVIEYARDSFGLALAAESYGARIFSQDARPGGVLEHPGKLSPDAQKNLKESWNQQHAGLGNAHSVAVLAEGMKWHQVGMTSEDAQFLETRQFQVADIARWFRVPLHMIQEVSKETSWGSGIEQLEIAFIIYTMLPWAVRWEQAISRDLIIQTDKYYAEFMFDALMRADIKTRYEAYQIAAGGNAPFMIRNEIRQRENLNPIDGFDEPLMPLNMRGINDPLPEPKQQPITPKPQPQRSAHYDLLLKEAAGRVARKEIAVLSKAAKRCASDSDMWRRAVEEFYGEHVEFVRGAMGINGESAEMYCSEQVALLLDKGAMALDYWESDSIEALLELVTGELSHAV